MSNDEQQTVLQENPSTEPRDSDNDMFYELLAEQRY